MGKGITLAGSAIFLFSMSALAATQKPNILFILADNQHAGLIGAYGNPDIKTPHIDRLAETGVKFTRAFAANGMCSPTRATLMTGLMPSQHGLHDWLNDEEMAALPREWSAIAEFRSVPYTLKRNGYKTAMIGKWHLGQPWQAPLGFDHWMTFASGHTTDFWKNTIIENGDVSEIEGRHMVDYFGDKAVEYIQQLRKDDKPFFLQVSFDGPYMDPPTNMGPARNRHYAYYEHRTLSSFPGEAVSKNYIEQLVSFAKSNEDGAFLNRIIKMVIGNMVGDQATRANMASQNTLVDDNVGRLLNALDQRGLDDNTIVIYSADQGTYYGQQGLWTHTVLSQPSTLQETALHIPLIVHMPGNSKGKVIDELVGQYDIPVTILELAGVDQELKGSPGKSFTSMLGAADFNKIHDAIFYEQTETRAIRTQRYAYWKRMDRDFGGDALYDMFADPEQRVNLISSVEHESIIADLNARLRAFYTTYSNPKYDLWNGGTSKGTISYPEKFRQRFGDDWSLSTELLPVFSE
ncbi:MAG: sulfatase-like hydrolase/transferase [Halieaceae bacterium]|nr:sulfatase-like hydrolase/transferase [Halieaceae bacterium]